MNKKKSMKERKKAFKKKEEIKDRYNLERSMKGKK